MSYADIFKWRITDSSAAADLQRSLLVRLGIPTPSQSQYRDHSQRISQSEGGIARHGYNNVEVLWTKLTPCQADTLRDIVDNSKAAAGGTGFLYMTIKPLDGSGVKWMDVAGKADLSDIAPDAPIIGASDYIHSNIVLRLNNVTVTSTDPTF
jgi:hypothetical protein